ncbi:MAG: hypothetical protein Q7R51_03290 [bacterium]|nr:hypothetical protein [bacterium]
MKLYNFERYYLSLFAFKILLFLKKLFSYKIAQYIGIAFWFFGTVIITVSVILYFFMGINVFLEKIHLEKYRIEEINFMHSKLDLRPFFSK